MSVFGRFFLIGLFLIGFHLCSQNILAMKVGLSNRLPDLQNVPNFNFKQTYLAVKVYEDESEQKNVLIFNTAFLVDPCDASELVTLKGMKNDSDYLFTLSDFSCDSSYRVSFYVRVKNQPAIKVSSLEALRSRNLIADESGKAIFEFTQVPVAVKPLWKNRSKHQISLGLNQANY